MKNQESEKYTKYEKARMIGARALQIAMGAPFIIKLSAAKLEELKYDPIKIANLEFEEGITPITVRRPLPKSRFATA
jgi:DNA-directed RNA polymerase subunit K